MLQKKNAGNYQTVSQGKIPEKISVSANLWTLFIAFIFVLGGSIVIENEDYRTKFVVSPIGLIHQTAVERI